MATPWAKSRSSCRALFRRRETRPIAGVRKCERHCRVATHRSRHRHSSPIWDHVVAWILIGAFAVNLTTSGDVLSSVGIAVGNTLEAVVATYLIRRWASGRAVFDRPHDVLRFALFAAALAPTVSATVGVASLEITGLAGWSDVCPIWLTWWLGDAAGALLVAPAAVLWATSRFPFAAERLAEAVVLAIAAVTTGVVIFGGVGPLSVYRVPVAFLPFPVLVWAAF